MVFHHFTSMVGETNRDWPSENSPADKNRVPAEQAFLADVSKHINVDNLKVQSQEREKNLGRVAGFAVGVGSLYLQEALGYPFIVLRHQCQVNHTAKRYHVHPFLLFRAMERMHHRQGVSVFWKGWGSTCIVNGMTIFSEIAICELLRLPRSTIERNESGGKTNQSKREIFLRETLKGLSLVVTLPLYSAALTDMVQSLALDEQRGLFSFVRDAFQRVIGQYQSRGHGRLLPFYSLIVPTLMYHLLRYSIKSFFSFIIVKQLTHRYNVPKKSTDQKSMRKIYYTELVSNLLSSVITDLIIYPLETVIVRLHIQGTRTIIDDLDKGIGVVPICTNYEGVVDCFKTVKREEGIAGLYKGYGATFIQYVIQGLIVKASKPFYRLEG